MAKPTKKGIRVSDELLQWLEQRKDQKAEELGYKYLSWEQYFNFIRMREMALEFQKNAQSNYEL